MAKRKVGRPRKTLTVAEVRNIDVPVVYGLSNSDRGIFYVGQTVNIYNRMRSYTNPANCHNKELADYLVQNPEFVIEILEYNPGDLTASEYEHIRQRIGSVFNIALNPYIIAKVRSVQPWNAGSGRRCPSGHMMWRAARASKRGLKDSFKEILDVIGKMSVSERCAFEVSVYKDMDGFTKRILSKWIELTRDGMLKAMEYESG